MSDQEEVAMDDQIEEPKKGRGKKAATKTKADEASDEPPVKRGRGRPPGKGKKAAPKAKPAPKPKKQVDDEDANGEAEDEDADKAPPKKGRGRPPKAAAKGAKAKAAKSESESEQEEEEEDDISEHEEVAPPAKAKNGKAAAKPAAKNGHSDVDEEADEDADEEKADAASSDARIKIVVEHCKSCHTYRKRADEIIDALKEKWSGIEVDYNPKAPRRGSFEINLINDSGKEVLLWTGLKKGPPRKNKFPDPEIVVEEMTKVYDSGKE